MSGDTRGASTAYTYSIDTLGDLRTVRLNGTIVATYAYDASDRRVSKTVGSAVTHYIYDLAGRLIAEADGTTGGTLKEYIWADDLPIGYVTDVATTPVLYYVHADHLKAPQKITDATKAIVWDGQFRPFGEARTITGSLTQNLRFPGQFFDAESLLHQNWNRDYDPTTGRYIQSDPIGLAGGINTYAYVGGNPLIWADPTGLSGPYHPPDGVRPGCRQGDTCQQIKGKVWLLERMIASHQGWDWSNPPPRGGGRHALEISELWGAWERCQKLSQKMGCDRGEGNCTPIPAPDSRGNDFGQSNPAEGAAGLTTFGIILLMLSGLMFQQ